MSTKEKIVDQFKKDLSSNDLDRIIDGLSDDEIYEIVSISSLSIGHSDVLIKKSFFAYIFFTQDKNVWRKTKKFLNEVYDFKEGLSTNNKRMVTFFLKNGILSSSIKARHEFLNTYGYKSKTRYIKKNSSIDKMKFTSFYQSFIKTVLSGIRNSKIKRFPHIGILKKYKGFEDA